MVSLLSWIHFNMMCAILTLLKNADPNDLDMDYFCHYIIAPELAEIT